MSSPAALALGPLLQYLPFQKLNKVQEAVIPSLFTNDGNCLIAAPTGSGKTVLLEVAMLRLFRHVLASGGNVKSASRKPAAAADIADSKTEIEAPSLIEKRKAVYICPIKALANEKYEHWRRQFPFLSVVIETGDQMQQRDLKRKGTADEVSAAGNTTTATAAAEDMSSVSQADILVTTPERWDSITRRWKEKEVMAIVNSVGLLLLDEVHTVQEERGAAMEAIVSRVKAIQAATLHSATNSAATTRIVAISGTLPNIRDMAEWLEVSPAMTFAFSAADRPVSLTIKVISYAHDSPNPFAFHRFLSFKLFSLIQQFSDGKPTLVFCASRKEVTSTAAQLVEDIRAAATRRGQLAQLQPSEDARRLSQQASDKQLRGCLLTGVGFHHAAMTTEDRLLVERMFREQYIAVVCSTTTLALGVNLPAHLVVIKGTTFFANGQCQDASVTEVMQMCGRAGRPGMDAHGLALVLTTQRKSYLYDTLRNGAVTLTCVESHLHRNMIEHVNAEVALRTIQSFRAATDWVKTTFFWIRLQRCPRHYGLKFASKTEEDEFSAEAFVEALMERVLRVLLEEGCISIERTAKLAEQEELQDRCSSDEPLGDIRQPSATFEPTRLGRAMSRMYILFDTVCMLNAALQKRGVAKGGTHAQADNEDADDDAVMAVTTATGDVREGEQEEEDEEQHTREEAVASAAPFSFLPSSVPTTVTTTKKTAMQPEGGGVAKATVVVPAAATAATKPFTLQETLQLLCQCQELVEVRLRQGDRGPLNEINRAVRFPLHSGRRGGREVREDWHKAYLLIQAHVGLLPITEVSLRNDATRLWSVVPRVSRFVEEYAWAQTSSYTFACCANLLARCMERRVWPDGPVLRQLPHVSDAVAESLLRGGYRGFDSLRCADARQLEVLCSRLPPFGTQLLSHVRSLPYVQMELQVTAPECAKTALPRGASVSTCYMGTVRVFLSPFLTADPAYNVEHASADPPTRGIGPGTDAVKRQGGKVALTESAVRDGRALLIVGAPAADVVLLKRFVPLSALSRRRTNSPDREVANTECVDSMVVACFTFPIAASLVQPSVAQQDGGTYGIEASCFVLHMVGLDAMARVCGSVLQTAAGRPFEVCSALSTSSEARALANIQTPTLDQFWSATTAGKKMHDHNANAEVQEMREKSQEANAVQTTVSAQVAAEARASFTALCADMTYIASADKAARRQKARERKRPRSEPAETATPAFASKGSVASSHEAKGTPQKATQHSCEAHAAATPTSTAAAADTDAAGAAATAEATPEAAVKGETVATPPHDGFVEAERSRSFSAAPQMPPQCSPRAALRSHEEAATPKKAHIDNEPQRKRAPSCSPAIANKRDAGGAPVRLPRCASPPATCPAVNVSACPSWAHFRGGYTTADDSAPPFASGDGVPTYQQGPAPPESVHDDGYRRPRWHFSTNATRTAASPTLSSHYSCMCPTSAQHSHSTQRRCCYAGSSDSYTGEVGGMYGNSENAYASATEAAPHLVVGEGAFLPRRRSSASLSWTCPSIASEATRWCPQIYQDARDAVWQQTSVQSAPSYVRSDAERFANYSMEAYTPQPYYAPRHPPLTRETWSPTVHVARWPVDYAHTTTVATPPTPPISFLSSELWQHTTPHAPCDQTDAPPVSYSVPGPHRNMEAQQPRTLHRGTGGEAGAFSTAQPSPPHLSSSASAVPSAFLPSQRWWQPTFDVRGRAISCQAPTTSSVVTRGTSFTPHARQSAMVPQSWWQ